MHNYLSLIIFALLTSGAAAQDFPDCLFFSNCPPTYFLVGEIIPQKNDSYALLLTEQSDIFHAYELIFSGPFLQSSIVVARIGRWGGEGINLNRNYLDPNAPSWSWYVTEFVGFADYTIELCDGWPGWVEEYSYFSGQICFWDYTVVAELGTDLDPWCYVLEPNCFVDQCDLELLVSQWLDSGCEYPDWCGGADLNVSGKVDFIDFALLAERWLQ